MSRRVLVTGAGGFVGSHVVENILKQTDWYVVAIDSLRHNGMVDNFLHAVRGHSHVGRISWVTHDLTVPFSAKQRRRIGDIDFIVNVASQSHVDDSIAEPYEFITNNIQLMMTILELARAVNPQRLIHMSTDEVFGPDQSWGHMPSSPYAASKAAQEDLIKAYSRTYALRSTIVNSANMFGERQSALAFIPRIINALLNGTTLSIHLHNGEPGERNYTYVRNVATRIVDEMLDVDSATWRRVSLSGQRRIDNLSLAHMVAGIANMPIKIDTVDADAVRPGYDPTYADLSGNWTPLTSFDDGLKSTVDWALKHND